MHNKKKIFRNKVNVSLPGILAVPDPLQVYTTFEWFVLDSLAENLIRYEHASGQFVTSLASEWSIDGNKVTFQISKGLTFSDGTPLSVSDIKESFQRVLDKRISTHFAVWNAIKSLTADKQSLTIDYDGDKETLFLFLSSPEASIWSQEDLKKEVFKPSRFSGFYYLAETSTEGILLKKNPNSIRFKIYPNAPEVINIFGSKNRWQTIDAIRAGEIDAFIGDYIPFSSHMESDERIDFFISNPLVFIHLLAMRDDIGKPFTPEFLEKIWTLQDSKKMLTPAFSILPPGQEGAIGKEDTLETIGEIESQNTKKVIFGAPPNYLSPEFQQQVKNAAKLSGMTIEFQDLDRMGFLAALENPSKAPFDYLMVGYVASDKFPFVQLKLITGLRDIEISSPPENLSNQGKIDMLIKIQKDFLHKQLVIPLFYVPSVIAHRPDFDIGNQPTTDAELQFWRFNENIKTD